MSENDASNQQSDHGHGQKVDKELEEFRSLMEPPTQFTDGFTWMAFLGTLFVAILMVPGSIYMTLLAGMAIGPAAQWVTLILFIEVARRANRVLKNAEIFTLFYIAGAVMSTVSIVESNFHGGLSLLWNQYMIEANAFKAQGLAEQIPYWVAPNDQEVLDRRSFFQWEWLPAIGVAAFMMLIGRIDNMILGYGLFRITSDVERLPFPMAPLEAQGILALSEEQSEELGHTQSEDEPEAEQGQQDYKQNWRWRVFSIGSVMGLIFGAIYLGLPTITGALLSRPITIIPLPFIDYTQQTSDLLPAAPVAIALDLGMVIMGMVLPFWAMVGSFSGLVITWIMNPILYAGIWDALPLIGQYDGGILSSWNTGDDMQITFYKAQVDFYFSFSIGVALAIGLAGIISVFRTLLAAKRQKSAGAVGGTAGEEKDIATIKQRGDMRWPFIIAVYVISAALYIGVSCYLLWVTDGFVYMPLVWIMFFYAVIYTPFISYVTARLEGIAGEVINIPFVREASFILSGYQGMAVWFLPMPFHNYGQTTMRYRTAELTGTKFKSIWKAELILMPIVLVGSLAFGHFIWQLGRIPGPNFLYAQEWWPVTAAQKALVFSSTGTEGFSEFEEALNWKYIVSGLGVGGFLFYVMTWLGAPIFLVYGVVRGLNQTLPFVVIPQFVGALIGRFYFQRKMGLMWRQYIPVVAAGFMCGMGLIGTLGIGFTLLSKSVFKLPF